MCHHVQYMYKLLHLRQRNMNPKKCVCPSHADVPFTEMLWKLTGWVWMKTHYVHSIRKAFYLHLHMFMFTLSASCPQCWPQWSLQLSAHVSPHLCLHPRPCVWKPRSVSWPGYFFGYLPQWPPWNGCKCLVCTARGDWPACFFAGPVFSNNAHFYGLAVFIDTYSNDDATDVSGGSGFTRQHDVSTLFFFFFTLNWHVVTRLLAC